MTVRDLAPRLNAEVLCGAEENLAALVQGGYCGDLLSWVMGRAREADAWVTIMSNLNVAAVAHLTGVACVVLSEDVSPDDALLTRAAQEGIPLLRTRLSSFEACLRIHEALL